MPGEPRSPDTRLDWSRWDEIDQLFEQVLDQPAERRQQFLDDATSDPRLKAAVRQLLDASGSTGSFSSILSGDHVISALEEAAEESLPAAIGPFRVVRQIGRGGMGTVLLAERAGSDFHQVVAIKLLRRGLDTDDLLRRFRAERRILAALNHPHIAKLVDGGSTPDGRPWLAMEYVDGTPLPEYCSARNLAPRERVHLARSVALAVQEAHRNLVIHRDIKPSNVLVTADGVPKLLDFGIAKLIDDDTGDSDAPETRTGLRLLTPRYAAPEQRRAERVSTATDVFQLGVLLVETMTGSRPDAESLAGTVPAGLPGDLARIAAMALRDDQARRYASAAAFVDDLDRWLDGRPVSARPDSMAYRTRKFLQRHRWVAPAAALALVLGAGWLATTLDHARELARERDAAQAEAFRADEARNEAVLAQEAADRERDLAVLALARADSLQHLAEEQRDRAGAALTQAELEIERTRQVTEFLAGLFRAGDISQEARADTLSARTLLVRGAARVRTELADQPEVLAPLLTTLGEIALRLGLSEASALWSDAIAVQRQVYGPEDPRVAVALLQQARTHLALRGFHEAAPLLAEAIQIWRATPLASPDTLASMLYNHAVTIYELGDPGGAEAALQEAVAIHDRSGRRGSPARLSAQSRLALMAQRQDRPQEALEIYEEVLQAQRAAPDTPPITLAATLNNMASLLRTTGRGEDAERFYREAYELQLAHGDPTDRNTNVAANNYAGHLVRLGRNEEAAEVLAAEIARHREHFPPDHWRIGTVTGALAVHLQNLGRHPEAEPLRQEQVAVYDAALGADHSWTLQARVRLGQLLATLGQPDAAEAHLLAVDSLAQAVRDPENATATRAMVRAALVRLYEALGRAEDAARFRTETPGG
jgi:eukaryotic-like serine/threonine-protein kinase